ncbi:hypothetical protein L7F22_034732 [Adiantum nelumboides]|nr:hypothetical protein [Adiantum nelumboides]
MRNVEWYDCHKKGHVKKDCGKWQQSKKDKQSDETFNSQKSDDSNKGNVTESPNAPTIETLPMVEMPLASDVLVFTADLPIEALVTQGVQYTQNWIVDSGASFHVTPHREWFSFYSHSHGKRNIEEISIHGLAGQGYLWLGHWTPDMMAWDLAKRSKYLWEKFAQGLQAMGLDPLVTLGFKRTGSLLFGTSSKHALALQEKAEALCKGGVQAEFLNSAQLMDAEPQLHAGAKGSAVLTPDDCQIDANLAASYMLGEIQKYSPSGRFQEFFYEPVMNFLWAGQVKGIQTNRREIYCNKKLVMAAGAWSGQLMQSIFDQLSLPHVLATKPRKGHLLVLEGISKISLKHGLMEYAYKELLESSADGLGIASTVTVDAKGRVLLGISQILSHFAGFDYNLQYDVMEIILKKAADYLPVLANLRLSDALSAGSVRVGHRPSVPDGRPMIGEVTGLEGLLLATGHEGEGFFLVMLSQHHDFTSTA